MNEYCETIRDSDNTQSFIQKNKAATFTFSISLILHIALLMIFMNSNKPCSDCRDDTQDNNSQEPKFKTYLLKLPTVENIPEQNNQTTEGFVKEGVKTIITSQSDKIDTTIEAVSKQQKTLPKQKTVVLKPVQALEKVDEDQGMLDYAKLQSSINHVIEQDNQIIKGAIFEDCEAVKKKTGFLDCVSNIERLGFSIDDPYSLSKIFKSLDKNPDNKKKERLLAKLSLNKDYIITVLDTKELPALMRQQFEEEIAFIRGEIHYLDCDGKPNSGNCAGEIDLGKIGKLLGLLFAD